MRTSFLALALFAFALTSFAADSVELTPEVVLKGLREFYAQTAHDDGFFRPGVDRGYLGMSDSAYSDIAAVTYACTIHKTFGWQLPHEEKTIAWLQARQKENGSFFNVAGTVDPDSPQGKTYNTTQAVVALHALGAKPKHDPLPIFEEILKADYKQLPAYSTSFFPLAYLCCGKAIPEKADKGIRALMIQDETGYTNDHVAATFHASHYYRLIGEETPKAEEMVTRILRDQQPDGSWLMNKPQRDRHATFDAVFTLLHEGAGRAECKTAIDRAAMWALSCRNKDGGFGHYPGSTSDADANYFQVGTLVMAGWLKPADPLPADPHLLSWGHMMPTEHKQPKGLKWRKRLGGWVGDLSFMKDASRLAAVSSDGTASLFFSEDGELLEQFQGKAEKPAVLAAVAHSPDRQYFVTGGYDNHLACRMRRTPDVIWYGSHEGPVLDVAYSTDGNKLASASMDCSVILWNVAGKDFRRLAQLEGHRSWVNSVAFEPNGNWLASGSSDGTVRIWPLADGAPKKTLNATKAEVYSIAISPDGKHLAAGLRYGRIKAWDTTNWQETLDFDMPDGDINAVCFSPDSKLLATGNGDWNRPGLVRLWKVPTGEPAGQLQQTGEVLSLAWSSRNHLAAGCGDKTLRLWDMNEALKK